MMWDVHPVIPIYDERRRPRRDAPAADRSKEFQNTVPAPPCLGEALRRGTLVNAVTYT